MGGIKGPFELRGMQQDIKRAHKMACLELRGGNHRESYSVELPGLCAWISCRPLVPAVCGGDLHYLTVCGEGAISRIVLADVAGHGEGVALVADRLRYQLRRHVNTWDQTILMQELNESFLGGANGVQYATAFVLGHYVRSGEVVFTNAGHVPPLWYHASECTWAILNDSVYSTKEIADLPVGLIPGTPYTQTAIQLEVGDLLVIYTDGISESRDESDRELGCERLCAFASRGPVGLPSEVGEALFFSVALFRGDAPATDDETIIVLKRTASSSQETLNER